MITIGAFNSSLIEVETLLKSTSFLKQKGTKLINRDGVSDAFKLSCCKDDYKNSYHIALKNYDFDFLLFDNSFFQFELKDNLLKDGLYIRYAFFQNPQIHQNYTDFIEFLRKEGIIDDETDEDIGDSLQDEYEQFLLEQDYNTNATTIRFDFDPKNYYPLIHSCAHIHIGFQTDIRLPCDKILTPLKFVLFVLKHSYYYNWKNLIQQKNADLLSAIIKAKPTCKVLLPNHWHVDETQELYLN